MTAKKLAAGLVLFWLGPVCGFPGLHRPAFAWWEFSLVLKTDGKYRVEEPGTSFSGSFRFTIRWTGRLEQDEDDFLLVRFQNEIIGWEIEETPSAAGSFRVMTQKDIAQEPDFNLKYILKKGNALYLDFATEGFPIPLNPYIETFPLNLPASEENSLNLGGVGYNLSVIEGSNRIAIPESEIFLGPVKRSFNWTWKHQEWALKQNRTIFISGWHKVSVVITLTPNKEKAASAR